MASRIALVLLMALGTIAAAQAPNECPWLTRGSAANVLGGDVTVVAHADGNWEGSCIFSRPVKGETRTIEVRVSKTNTHSCPQSSTIVKALGNEAVQCQRITPQGERAEMIAGRVRDAYFVVSMIHVPEATRVEPVIAHSPDPYGASPLEREAEQVAGNLF